MTFLETPAEYAARDVDLHVHTLTSRCGYTSHRRLLELTRTAGRRVLAVTDHDSAAGGVELGELAARTGDDVLVLIGMELTTSDFGHVVLFGRGLERDWGWKTGQPFPRHIPDHWIAIQAHPYRGKVTVRDGRASAEELPDPRSESTRSKSGTAEISSRRPRGCGARWTTSRARTSKSTARSRSPAQTDTARTGCTPSSRGSTAR